MVPGSMMVGNPNPKQHADVRTAQHALLTVPAALHGHVYRRAPGAGARVQVREVGTQGINDRA